MIKIAKNNPLLKLRKTTTPVMKTDAEKKRKKRVMMKIFFGGKATTTKIVTIQRNTLRSMVGNRLLLFSSSMLS